MRYTDDFAGYIMYMYVQQLCKNLNRDCFAMCYVRTRKMLQSFLYYISRVIFHSTCLPQLNQQSPALSSRRQDMALSVPSLLIWGGRRTSLCTECYMHRNSTLTSYPSRRSLSSAWTFSSVAKPVSSRATRLLVVSDMASETMIYIIFG